MTDSKQTIAHIKAQIKSGKLATQVLTISPEVATYLIELNWSGNRNLQQSVVDRYATEMRHGNWMLTGEPLILSWDGVVIDGQHRLWAVIESAQTVDMNVTFGIDPDAYCKINSGSTRNLAYRAGMAPGHAAALNFIVKTVFGQAECSDTTLRLIDPIYGAYVDALIALQTRRMPVLRAAPVVAAGAIWSGDGMGAYVQNLYASMIALDSGALTPIAKSFLKQTVELAGTQKAPKGLDLFVRAFKAFDHNSAQATRLQHKGAISTLDEARGMVVDAMKRHGVTLDRKATTAQRGVGKRTSRRKAA
jgi:hypothetical protein